MKLKKLQTTEEGGVEREQKTGRPRRHSVFREISLALPLFFALHGGALASERPKPQVSVSQTEKEDTKEKFPESFVESINNKKKDIKKGDSEFNSVLLTIAHMQNFIVELAGTDDAINNNKAVNDFYDALGEIQKLNDYVNDIPRFISESTRIFSNIMETAISHGYFFNTIHHYNGGSLLIKIEENSLLTSSRDEGTNSIFGSNSSRSYRVIKINDPSLKMLGGNFYGATFINSGTANYYLDKLGSLPGEFASYSGKDVTSTTRSNELTHRVLDEEYAFDVNAVYDTSSVDFPYGLSKPSTSKELYEFFSDVGSIGNDPRSIITTLKYVFEDSKAFHNYGFSMRFSSAIVRDIFKIKGYGDFDKILDEAYIALADDKISETDKKKTSKEKLLFVLSKLDKEDLERIRNEFVQLGKNLLKVLPNPTAKSGMKK